MNNKWGHSGRADFCYPDYRCWQIPYQCFLSIIRISHHCIDLPEPRHIDRGLENDERVRRVMRVVPMADGAQISRLLAARTPEPTPVNLLHVSVAERKLVREVSQVFYERMSQCVAGDHCQVRLTIWIRDSAGLSIGPGRRLIQIWRK